MRAGEQNNDTDNGNRMAWRRKQTVAGTSVVICPAVGMASRSAVMPVRHTLPIRSLSAQNVRHIQVKVKFNAKVFFDKYPLRHLAASRTSLLLGVLTVVPRNSQRCMDQTVGRTVKWVTLVFCVANTAVLRVSTDSNTGGSTTTAPLGRTMPHHATGTSRSQSSRPKDFPDQIVKDTGQGHAYQPQGAPRFTRTLDKITLIEAAQLHNASTQAREVKTLLQKALQSRASQPNHDAHERHFQRTFAAISRRITRLERRRRELDRFVQTHGAPACVGPRPLLPWTNRRHRQCPRRSRTAQLGGKVQIMVSTLPSGGFGLFATRPIAKGEIVGDFPGQPTSASALIAAGLRVHDSDVLHRKLSTVFRLRPGSNTALDPTEADGMLAFRLENALAFTNEPPPKVLANVVQAWGDEWPVQFRAAADIRWGDELFVCYFWPEAARAYAVNTRCVGGRNLPKDACGSVDRA